MDEFDRDGYLLNWIDEHDPLITGHWEVTVQINDDVFATGKADTFREAVWNAITMYHAAKYDLDQNERMKEIL